MNPQIKALQNNATIKATILFTPQNTVKEKKPSRGKVLFYKILLNAKNKAKLTILSAIVFSFFGCNDVGSTDMGIDEKDSFEVWHNSLGVDSVRVDTNFIWVDSLR